MKTAVALMALAACPGACVQTAPGDASVDAVALDAATHCPNDLPSSCPSPAPGFDASIGTVVATTCMPCHQPGGVASDRPLTTYAQIHSRRGEMLTQVFACQMPPADAGQLSADQRVELLTWLVCGAPLD